MCHPRLEQKSYTERVIRVPRGSGYYRRSGIARQGAQPPWSHLQIRLTGL
jgi:hypothetical protein